MNLRLNNETLLASIKHLVARLEDMQTVVDQTTEKNKKLENRIEELEFTAKDARMDLNAHLYGKSDEFPGLNIDVELQLFKDIERLTQENEQLRYQVKHFEYEETKALHAINEDVPF